VSAARGRLRALLAGALCVLAPGVALAAGDPADPANPPADARLVIPLDGRHVVLMRHATAPGVGDPPGYRLDDCATQRNLSDEGRAEARAAGDRLRAAGLAQARVFTSAWCRCRETATLLGLGPVALAPPLDSFFEATGEADRRTAALRAFIRERLSEDLTAPVLVTHQVNITALTKLFPASGEMLVLRVDGEQPPVVVRRMTVAR